MTALKHPEIIRQILIAKKSLFIVTWRCVDMKSLTRIDGCPV